MYLSYTKPSIEDIAPGIYAIINPVIKARRTVAQALTNSNWIDDIKKPINIDLFLQVLAISEECSLINISPTEEDKWSWSWETKGTFTTKSVYKAHYAAKISCDLATAIWGSWAPLRCKFAAWLFIRNRVWTADRLAKRGLPHNEKCSFCNTNEEDAQHLFMGCAISNIIWSKVLTWANFQTMIPPISISLQNWWQEARKTVAGKRLKKFDSIVMLTSWSIWKERNNRVFEKTSKPANVICDQIIKEAEQWNLASKGHLYLSAP